MATSTPQCYITSSISQFHPMSLTKSRNSINLHSPKELCNQGSLKEAFNSLGRLLTHQVSHKPSLDGAYAPILDLCAKKKALSQGQQLHAHLIKSCALWDSVFLSTKIVHMYGKCGSIWDAQKVFDKMSQRTIFTWNAMISAYASNGEPFNALGLYSDMRVFGVLFDSCTFPCILKACVAVKDLCSGEEIHGLAIKYGYDNVSFVVNSLVAMYASCNNLDGARKLFDGIKEEGDIVSWNSIISAYSAKGLFVEALGLFREMQKVGLAMNTYTFVAALQACDDSFSGKLGFSRDKRRVVAIMGGGRVPLKRWQQAAVAVGSAVGALLDPRRADLIAALGETTGKPAFERVLQRMKSSPEGRAILLEKPRVISANVGYAWDLPENTFGAAYAKFMGSRNFSPDDRPPVRFMETDELAYVAMRAREVHDFWHTLFGLPTNLMGESALKVIEFQQMYLPMCLMSVVGGSVRFNEKQRNLFFQHYFPWAIRAGMQSTDLMCIYYEKHFHEDLEDVRKKWGITPAPGVPKQTQVSTASSALKEKMQIS